LPRPRCAGRGPPNRAPRAGADEGAFAWLTLNYLLGNLGKGEARTMAAIDLGGGSVQQAYALTAFEAAAAPDGYITKLAGGGRTYSVYVHRRAARRTPCAGSGAPCSAESLTQVLRKGRIVAILENGLQSAAFHCHSHTIFSR